MFSDAEKKLLKVLGRKKKTITELTIDYYGDLPYGKSNYIASVVRRINAKCEHHGTSWYLNGKGLGRGGKTVWREKL